MNSAEFHETVLQLAVEDHELLSQFTTAIARMFVSKSKADAKKASQAITVLSNKAILKHFAYEEAKVFRPLLATQPKRKIANQVAKFQVEHKRLLKQLQQLDRLLKKYDLPADAGVLWKALMGFLNNFEDHANKEDAFFHFLLDEQPTRSIRRTRPVALLAK